MARAADEPDRLPSGHYVLGDGSRKEPDTEDDVGNWLHHEPSAEVDRLGLREAVTADERELAGTSLGLRVGRVVSGAGATLGPDAPQHQQAERDGGDAPVVEQAHRLSPDQ